MRVLDLKLFILILLIVGWLEKVIVWPESNIDSAITSVKKYFAKYELRGVIKIPPLAAPYLTV